MITALSFSRQLCVLGLTAIFGFLPLGQITAQTIGNQKIQEGIDYRISTAPQPVENKNKVD